MTTIPNLPPPKKPVNSFFCFQREKLSEFRQANPGKKLVQITKLLGATYNKLPITEKQKYEGLAAANRERYKKEQPEETFHMATEIKLPPPKKTKPIPPKKAINAFFHFQRENLSEFLQANPGKKLPGITKLLGQAYKNLPITEKNKYADLAVADRERYEKEYQEYMEKCTIYAKKRTKSFSTYEESKENSPKKMKGEMVKDAQKYTSDKENNMIFEDAAGSRPDPDPNKLNFRRNSLNQICFVETDEVSGKEILVPGVYLLNEMVNSIAESKLTPEIWQKIETARQKDKENVENAKENKMVAEK